jgi:hypothetical protein
VGEVYEKPFKLAVLSRSGTYSLVLALANSALPLVPGSLGEPHNWNSENFRDMFAWSEILFADTFG